jgi:membrane-bound inhibitor of C-type lysozyme
MNTRAKIIVLAIVIVLLALAILRAFSSTSVPKLVATVSYMCNAGKTIDAGFYEGPPVPSTSPEGPPTPGGRAALTLSDGRNLTLAQTISADGVRYATADESFVFWDKGNGALVLENNKEKSYIGCIKVAPQPAGLTLAQVYANSGDGFSVRLPSGYTSDASYRYQELGPGKDIAGVKFTIPARIATNTNLAADTYVSVEEIPKSTNCSANLFLEGGASAHTVVEGDTTYSVASTTGAGAGNRYEETVFALPGTNPCMAVRYFIHYGVFENYPVGAIQEFDDQALQGEFDAIRRTLVIVQ